MTDGRRCQIPELYAAVVLVALLGYARQRRAARRSAAYALLGRGGAVDAVKASTARRFVGPALGVLVFLAVLGIWQLWARSRELLPRADGERGGSESVGRLADVGLPVGGGREHEALRGRLRHSCGDRHLHRVARRDVARCPAHARSLSRMPASGAGDCDRAGRLRPPRGRRRVAHRGHRLRPLLPDPRQHRRGRARHSAGGEGHRVDAARRAGGARRADLPAGGVALDHGWPAHRGVAWGSCSSSSRSSSASRTASATT